MCTKVIQFRRIEYFSAALKTAYTLIISKVSKQSGNEKDCTIIWIFNSNADIYFLL